VLKEERSGRAAGQSCSILDSDTDYYALGQFGPHSDGCGDAATDAQHSGYGYDAISSTSTSMLNHLSSCSVVRRQTCVFRG